MVNASAEGAVRDRRVAVHEAAHAVVALALGASVEDVGIEPSGRAEIVYQMGNPIVVAEKSIVVAMAAAHAENWALNWTCTAFDADIESNVDHTRSSPDCGCDRCVSMRFLTAVVGQEASTEQLFSRYRHYEADAIRLVQSPAVWRAICDLADELLLRGVVSGADATSIIARHVRPEDFQ
ncbi:hypothetical protein ATY77_26665 [Rhizobium sp. R634]|uniref:hypothetical protein n=1 Tax=Rhizobium sp. R634 TaxID=1764274 RepID=UPI000B52EBF0|nr:hypothetical protein [Rhizobium sp. R634]OWV79573.1 hypothetical protein ATY77_26665 [Rhizobium sp. R634]